MSATSQLDSLFALVCCLFSTIFERERVVIFGASIGKSILI